MARLFRVQIGEQFGGQSSECLVRNFIRFVVQHSTQDDACGFLLLALGK